MEEQKPFTTQYKTRLDSDSLDLALSNINNYVSSLGQEIELEKILKIVYNELRKAEIAIRESEEKFRTIFKSAPLGIAIATPEGRFLETNDWFSRILGYEKEELLDKTFMDISHPGDREESVKQARLVREGKADYYIQEKRYIKKNGEIVWGIIKATAIKDKVGALRYWIGVVEDISERKEAKQKILTHDMGERLKELNCLYSVANSIKIRKNLDEIFKDIASYVPPGWHYPDITRGKIRFDDKEFVSKTFEESAWKQTSDIIVKGKKRGSIEVYYLRECPVLDEGPFMKEERALIDSISKSLSEAIERRETQEALKESEEKYRELVQNANSIIMRFNTKGEATFINEYARVFFGFKEKEILGKSINNTILPKIDHGGKNLENMIKKLLADPSQFVNNENENLKKNGERPWINWSNKAILDNRGKISEILCIGNDVTILKQIEFALRDSELRNRMLLETLPHGVEEVALDGTIIYANESYHRICGYKNGELIGKKVYDMPATKKERENLKRYIARLVKEQPKPIRYIGQNRRKDGKIIDIETDWDYLRDEKKNITGFIAIVTDVTKRKKAEDRLIESEIFARTTLDGLSSNIAILDKDGVIEAVNKAWREFAHSNSPISGNVHEGSNYLEICNKAEGKDSAGAREFAQGIREVLSGRKNEYEMECPCHSPDEKRWFVGRVTRFPGEGSPRVVVAHENITQRKIAELALAESEAKYRNLYQSAMVGLYRSRIDDGQILTANETMANIMGYESLDQYIKEFKTAEHFAEDSKREEMAKLIKKNGRVDNFEIEAIKKDGSHMHIAISAVAYEKKGYYEGVVVDITERKKAESALEYRLQFEKLISDISTRFINLEADKIDLGIKQALKQLCSFARAEAGQVFLISEDQEMINLAYVWAPNLKSNYPYEIKDISTSSISWLMERLVKLKSTVIADINELPPEAKGVKRAMEEQNLKSIVCVPMIYQSKLKGFLGFSSISTRREWSDDELALLKMVGQIFTNAIERKEAEVAVIKSEEKYRNIFKSTAVSIWEEDHSGVIKAIDKLKKKGIKDFNKYFNEHPEAVKNIAKTIKINDVNDAAIKIYHAKNKDELLGSLDKLYSDDSYESLKNQMIAVAEGKTSYEAEAGQKTLDGNAIDIFLKIAIPKNKKDFDCVLVNIIDITKRKQTEEALSKSEEHHRGIYNASPLAFVVWDKQCRVTDWSKQAEKLFGWEEKEVLGKDFFNFLIPKSARPDVKTITNDLLAGKLINQITNENLTKSGRLVTCEWNNSILKDSNGKIIGALSMGLDITKRKQSEERFQAIVKTMAGVTGHDLYNVIVKTLSEWLEVDCVILGKLESKNKVKTLAMRLDGENIDNYTYNLEGTPCESVTKQGYCTYTDDVVKLFPDDKELVDLKARSYVGVPMRNKKGDTVGVLCAISRQKLNLPPQVEEAMKIIATRAATEIERQEAEERLIKSEHYLSRAQEMGKIGTWELDIKNNKLVWTDENYRIFGLPIGTELTFETFINCVHPEDKKSVNQAWQDALNKKPYDIEHRVIANGEIKWVREKAELEFDNKGNCVKGTGFSQDITNRKNAEEEISKLAKFPSEDPNPVLRVARDGKILYSNDAGLLLLTKWKKEIGNTIPASWQEIIEESFAVNDIFTKEVSYKGQNYIFAVTPVHGANYANLYGSNITERKKLEIALRNLNDKLEHKVVERTYELKKSEGRFKELWDRAPIAYHTLNTKGIITDVNNTEVEILGYKKEEMIGQPIFNFIIPGQRAEARKRFKEKLTGKKLPQKSDRFYQKKDGSLVCVSIDDILELDSFGKVTGVRTTLIDITKKHDAELALQESEEKYRSIVENATDYIFMVNKDYKIMSLNSAVAKVFMKKPEAVIGQSIYGLFPEAIARGYTRNLKTVFEIGRTSYTESAMVVGSNHSWISAILSPVRNTKGEITAVMGISRDISESKRAEKRTQITNELLQILNKVTNRKEYLELVVKLIKEWSGCQNIGIRLKNDKGDIPYEAYTGFSKKFWDSENWLNINEDQCACTRVIAGRPDKADRKVITGQGSWHCNNTAKYVEGLSQEERDKFRGKCVKSGFSTVAIIPIYLGKDTLGAIHLADKKINHIPLVFIELIESVTPLLGEAIQKFNIREQHDHAVKEIDRIFNISADLLSISNFEGYFKRINPAFEKTLGFSKNELLAKPFIDYVHPDDKNSTVKELKRLNNGLTAVDFENRYACENGTYRWLSWKAIPVKEEGLIYAIARDITEQKIADKTLQKSQKSLSEAQRIAGMGNWDWDLEKNKIYWSDEIYRIFGLKPQEFNADYETFLSLVHRDDRDTVDKTIKEALKEKKSYNIEHRIILPDGKIKTVQEKARVYSNSGKPVRIVGTVQDITKRKQAEKAIKRSSDAQAVINKILQISMKEIGLEKKLDNILDTLIAIPWFALESRGGIWLAEENKEELKLVAHRNLPESLLRKCSTIPYGRCLCGRAAKYGKIEYANHIDKRHETTYKEIKPHGHYCIPIKSKNKVLGVMNFYIREGHQYSYKEIEFLRAVSNIIAGIVERKRTDEALKKSEEKYRKLVDNADDGVAIINIDGFVVFSNQAMRNIIGYSAEELKTLHLLKYIHERDKDWVIKIFKERLAGERVPTTYEFRIKTKAGKTRYISYSGAVIKEKGKIIGIQAIVRDITDNRRLQAKIVQAKKHYEQVIDTIQDGICVIDKNYKIASCNRVFSGKVNLPIESIKGKHCKAILPLYENRLLKGHCARVMCNKNCGTETVFKSGQALSYIEENKDENGNQRYHNISIYPDKDSRGRIYQVVLTIRDITNRKKAEEEIRRLNEFNQRILDTSPVSMVVLNKEGKIIAANAIANSLMGKKGKQVVGGRLLETNEIKKNKILLELYGGLLKNGKSFYYDNLSYVPEDSIDKKYLNIIAVPLYDARKEVEGAISMALDNTEAIKAKQKLEYLNLNLENKVIQRTKELDLINQKLNQVLELKSKFIADASHELRTPLTVVQGNLELAIREAGGEAGKTPEIYTTIIGEVGRMSGILSDLTMLTNVDSRNEQIAYERVNLGHLIKAAGQSLKVLAEQKKIALIYNKGVRKIKVWGDEAKLEKLLLNIVRNAIKYTEPKGRVRIWTEMINSEARVIIEDNGIGIPQDDLPFIFERFYRVEKGRSRAEGGTGLGLSICKWVAEAHRGKISVESKIGKGTVFTVHIPFDYKKHGLANTLF